MDTSGSNYFILFFLWAHQIPCLYWNLSCCLKLSRLLTSLISQVLWKAFPPESTDCFFLEKSVTLSTLLDTYRQIGKQSLFSMGHLCFLIFQHSCIYLEIFLCIFKIMNMRFSHEKSSPLWGIRDHCQQENEPTRQLEQLRITF